MEIAIVLSVVVPIFLVLCIAWWFSNWREESRRRDR
jgi:hypothetical protein